MISGKLKHLPPSPIALLAKAWIKKNIRPRESLPKEKATAHFRRVCKPANVPDLLPKGIRLTQTVVDDVPCSHITPSQPSLTIIYYHGGGMVAGHPKTYHTFCATFAKRLNAQVYLPDYKLAPEHRFPIGVMECFDIYQALLKQGIPSESIVFMGDSAGGSISLALLHMIRNEGLPNPKCAVVMSPASDMRYTSGELERNDATDVMLSSKLIKGLGEDYVVTEDDRLSPYASPIMQDYDAQTPPIFIAASANECLYGDTKRLVEKNLKNGANITFYVRKNFFHVWPIMYPILPEAHVDIYEMCRFIKHV